MIFGVRVLNGFVRFVLRGILCRVHDEPLAELKNKSSLIVVANHVNFLEVPIAFSYLPPGKFTGFAKSETWKKNIFSKVLFDAWGAIPLKRGGLDLEAFRKAEAAIKQGKIFAVAPEGTRSRDGKLQKGLPGIVILALKASVPIYPIGFWGGEVVWENMRQLRKTDFYVNVGDPFTIQTHGDALSRDVRDQITAEIMYRIAALLPEQYRGYYSDLSLATTQFLHFLPKTSPERAPIGHQEPLLT